VSWDVLEQFMQDIPGDTSTVEQSPLEGVEDLPDDSQLLGLGSGSRSCDHIGGSLPSLPGLWPTSHPCGGAGAGSHLNGAGGSLSSCGTMNAASLAQSLSSCWQQHGGCSSLPLPHNSLAPVWGAEFLPNALGGPDDDRLGDLNFIEQDSPRANSSSVATDSRQSQKQRFVWTADLHRRFEIAVKSLGIDHAKPQAISQLMNCEGEGAPTRQNIKSHLQKYRLLMQKRARQDTGEPSTGGGGKSNAGGASARAAEGASGSGGGGAKGSGESRGTARGKAAPSEGAANAEASSASEPASDSPATFRSMMLEPNDPELKLNLEQHLERQEMNLKVQMELQTKLHRQLLVQRQLQHQLEHSFNGESADGSNTESQRWQATTALKNSLRERLTKHVVMQQEMLQHLDALVSSEVDAAASSDAAHASCAPSASAVKREEGSG